MDIYEEKKYNFVHNCKIPYLSAAGVVPEVIEKGHVRFVLTVKEMHMNHVGIVYAGSYFVFAESAGASLIFAAYAEKKNYVPIISNVSIDYLRPAKTDLVIDMSMSEEEAAEKIAPIDQRGKGRYPLDVPMYDMESNPVATAHITYYLFADAPKL